MRFVGVVMIRFKKGNFYIDFDFIRDDNKKIQHSGKLSDDSVRNCYRTWHREFFTLKARIMAKLLGLT